jgi:hypothetical protein
MNGKIYLIRGRIGAAFIAASSDLASVEGCDPATNTWSILTPMAIGRHGVAGGVVGNRFYAISGDVQSSGTGVMVSTPSADAFEFSK